MIITAPAAGSGTQLERTGTGGSVQFRTTESTASGQGSVSRAQPTPFWENAYRLENSYRLEPQKKFLPDKVKGIISQVLQDALANKPYDPSKGAAQACELCEKIKAAVKQLDIPRYKTVTMVTIGQLKDEGIRVASRCLWNPAFDSFASYSFKNSSLFAVGIVYACYLE